MTSLTFVIVIFQMSKLLQSLKVTFPELNIVEDGVCVTFEAHVGVCPAYEEPN